MKALSRVASLLLAVLVLMIAAPAVAHTELDHSEPSAEAEITETVSEIVVVFTLPVTPVGNGFEVLDPQGEIHQPTVETSDNTMFRLVMSEPLADGEVGVRYEVTAEDGHVLAGGFSFTVTAPAASSLPTATTSLTGVTTTIATTTTIVETTTTTKAGSETGSMVPWLIGGGLVVVAASGLIASLRSRSSR